MMDRNRIIGQRVQPNPAVDRSDVFRRQRPPSAARRPGHGLLGTFFAHGRGSSLHVRKVHAGHRQR